ncbi:MAG: hypothetical protein WBV61_02390 [Rhodanobacteraceae bacterium]
MILAAHPARALDATSPDIDYQLGNGLRIPGTDFSLGGYATGSYDRSDDVPSRTTINNLSLFLWWDGSERWKFFTELEYDNLLLTREDRKGENGYLSLERLYVDFALTDSINVRGGKFLTPIGRWNLIHATPLVWTTSRPLATTLAFPTNMTGVMESQTLPNIGSGVEYSLYAASGSEIRPNPAIDTFSQAFGGHVILHAGGNAQFGFSYAEFAQEQTRSKHKHLVGLDFVWMHNRYELSAEGIYRYSSDGTAGDERGGYVQFVAPLSRKLYAVARYETFRVARQANATQLWVGGLNYRITPALVLKAEWIAGSHNAVGAPTGFLSSISVLL